MEFLAWNDKAQLLLWPAMLLSLAAITNPYAIRSLALCVMIKTIFWIGVQNALLILGVLNVRIVLSIRENVHISLYKLFTVAVQFCPAGLLMVYSVYYVVLILFSQ